MTTQGNVVVVTGAGRGVGCAIATAFAGQGDRVALVDLLADPLAATCDKLRGAGGEVLPLLADITDPSQVQQMAQQLTNTWGTPDILVNCAGTFSVIGPIWEVDPERWLRDVRVNLYGTFLVCHHLVGPMVAAGRGYVVNIVSTGGVGDPHPYSTSYASSKTGLMRLTEGLAKEVESHGIKVFAVAPPAILTDMTRFILNDEGGKKWRPGFERIFEEGQDYPPEAVAQTVLQLVSGKADRLTGRYFDVREDIDELVAQQDDILANDRLTLRIRK
ncbi:MAG: SDR family oxidoreductase [Caldilineaceae bacterium]|nr:SDR family oxidoreductase [Caldilineaceae bacterium]